MDHWGITEASDSHRYTALHLHPHPTPRLASGAPQPRPQRLGIGVGAQSHPHLWEPPGGGGPQCSARVAEAQPAVLWRAAHAAGSGQQRLSGGTCTGGEGGRAGRWVGGRRAWRCCLACRLEAAGPRSSRQATPRAAFAAGGRGSPCGLGLDQTGQGEVSRLSRGASEAVWERGNEEMKPSRPCCNAAGWRQLRRLARCTRRAPSAALLFSRCSRSLYSCSGMQALASKLC